MPSILYGQVNGNIISHCVIGIAVLVDDGTSITDNQVSECSGYGILSSSLLSYGQNQLGHDTSMTSNDVTDCPLGITLNGTIGCDLNENSVTDCYTGILVNSSQVTNVIGNQVDGSFDGILLRNTISATVRTNTVTACADIGIALMSSQKAKITYNLISDSVSYGLLSNLSYGCTINLNQFIDNNGAGPVFIRACSGLR